MPPKTPPHSSISGSTQGKEDEVFAGRSKKDPWDSPSPERTLPKPLYSERDPQARLNARHAISLRYNQNETTRSIAEVYRRHPREAHEWFGMPLPKSYKSTMGRSRTELERFKAPYIAALRGMTNRTDKLGLVYGDKEGFGKPTNMEYWTADSRRLEDGSLEFPEDEDGYSSCFLNGIKGKRRQVSEVEK